MKVSSILKLGGIVHNEAEETVVSNINSTNMATLESTSLNSSFFIEPTSQELSKKTSSVPENNLIMCQPSLGNSSIDNNLITSQNTIFNDAHTDSINVVVTKENSMAENSFTTISTNSVETNLSQDIPQIIV